MSVKNAFSIFLEIAEKNIRANQGRLFLEFNRGDGDYAHKEAPHSANDLARCVTPSAIAEKSSITIIHEGQYARIDFVKGGSSVTVHDMDWQIIRHDNKGPSVEAFREACFASNLEQRQAFAREGDITSRTKVADVISHLRHL